jgi:hypothetical protein
MAQKQTQHRPHLEFRHRSQIPLPAVDDVEQRVLEVLSPSLLAPRQWERHDPRPPQRLIRMRQRLLTLPVMVALIVSLVWRRVPSIAEVQKVLTREGLLGMVPLQVSPQALTKRLDVLPATVMGQLFAEVCTRLQAQPPPLPHPRWAPVREHFPLLAMGGRLDVRSAAQNDAEPAAAGGAGVGRQSDGYGGSFQPPTAVAALYRGRPSS